MEIVYTYLGCFFAYSFLGWCGEVAFAAIRQKRFVNRGFLNGPLCPIYGLGAVAMDAALRPFGPNLTIQLLGSMLLGSVLEYAAGFLLEKLFHEKWWDYSDQPHNLHGYICLKFSVVWAAAGAVTVRYLMPFSQRLFGLIPRPVGWVLLALLGALLLADLTVTVVSIVGLNRKLRNLEYVTSKLRQGSDKLGRDISRGAMAAHSRRLARQQAWQKDWQKEAARLKVKYACAMRLLRPTRPFS